MRPEPRLALWRDVAAILASEERRLERQTGGEDTASPARTEPKLEVDAVLLARREAT